MTNRNHVGTVQQIKNLFFPELLQWILGILAGYGLMCLGGKDIKSTNMPVKNYILLLGPACCEKRKEYFMSKKLTLK